MDSINWAWNLNQEDMDNCVRTWMKSRKKCAVLASTMGAKSTHSGMSYDDIQGSGLFLVSVMKTPHRPRPKNGVVGNHSKNSQFLSCSESAICPNSFKKLSRKIGNLWVQRLEGNTFWDQIDDRYITMCSSYVEKDGDFYVYNCIYSILCIHIYINTLYIYICV